MSNSPEPLADYAGGGVTGHLETSDHWVQGEAVPHPEYGGFAGFPGTFDIGLDRPERAIDTGGVHGRLPEEGMLDELITRRGATTQHQVGVVGYGLQGTGGSGTCFGDSGGPASWIDPATGRETTTVVAVTSFGITGRCAGTDFSFRTDIPAARDFVDAHL